jgi:hypothetical protein
MDESRTNLCPRRVVTRLLPPGVTPPRLVRGRQGALPGIKQGYTPWLTGDGVKAVPNEWGTKTGQGRSLLSFTNSALSPKYGQTNFSTLQPHNAAVARASGLLIDRLASRRCAVTGS